MKTTSLEHQNLLAYFFFFYDEVFLWLVFLCVLLSLYAVLDKWNAATITLTDLKQPVFRVLVCWRFRSTAELLLASQPGSSEGDQLVFWALPDTSGCGLAKMKAAWLTDWLNQISTLPQGLLRYKSSLAPSFEVMLLTTKAQWTSHLSAGVPPTQHAFVWWKEVREHDAQKRLSHFLTGLKKKKKTNWQWRSLVYAVLQ